MLVPIIIVGISIGFLFIIWRFSDTPSKSLESMQVAMNHQYDRFQGRLAASTDEVVQFQRRTLQAEQLRRALTEQFERSQRELVETQRALQGANVTLLATQEALRWVQEDYERLSIAKSAKAVEPSAEPEPVPVSDAREEDTVFTEKLQALEKLRQDNLKIEQAGDRCMEYFERLWSDYTATGSALMLARSRLAKNRAGRPELIGAPASTDRQPELGHAVSVGGKEQDMVPQISRALLHFWIAERLNVRSAEMIALQRRVTKINQAIEEIQRDLIARQKTVAQVEAEESERANKP